MQRATVTVTRDAVVSTPSCSCCLDVVVEVCAYVVGITRLDDSVSTANKDTTGTAVVPSATAEHVDVCDRFFHLLQPQQCTERN